MKEKIIRYQSLFLLAFILAFPVSLNAQTLTPAQILAKTAAKLNSKQGIEAHFSVSYSGYTGKGAIKAKDGKFYVKFPDTQVWYNGSDLYTYNQNTGETTVVNPTSEELAQTNPLVYITSATKNFNVSESTVKKNGRYTLELKPKTGGAGSGDMDVKRVTLTIRKSDFGLEKVVIEPRSGSPITAEISEIKNGNNILASDFEYPRSKYSKVELIDLR